MQTPLMRPTPVKHRHNLTTCAICGAFYERQLSFHLRTHHRVDLEEYYLRYVLRTRRRPLCRNLACERVVPFRGTLGRGYQRFCSQRCKGHVTGKNMTTVVNKRFRTEPAFNRKCRRARSQNIQVALASAFSWDSKSTGYRSSWEKDFARHCYRLRIPFQYEPLTIHVGLPDRVSYTPDFYLPEQNLFVEVKPRDRLLQREDHWRRVFVAVRQKGFRIVLVSKGQFREFFKRHA